MEKLKNIMFCRTYVLYGAIFLGITIFSCLGMIEAIQKDNLKVNGLEYALSAFTIILVASLALIAYLLLDINIKSKVNKLIVLLLLLFIMPLMYLSNTRVDNLIQIGLLFEAILAAEFLIWILLVEYCIKEIKKKIYETKQIINYTRTFSLRKLKKQIREAIKNEYKL